MESDNVLVQIGCCDDGKRKSVAVSSGNAIDACGDLISQKLISGLFRTMKSNGASLVNPFIFINVSSGHEISLLYEYDREYTAILGVRAKTIRIFHKDGVLRSILRGDRLFECDLSFSTVGVFYSSKIPSSSVLIVDAFFCDFSNCYVVGEYENDTFIGYSCNGGCGACVTNGGGNVAVNNGIIFNIGG